jgi:predicted nucleic acid-binding protein
MEIFADTSFLVAFYNKRDKNYQEARNFISESDKNIAFIISDYIFDEVLTVLLIL